MTCGIYQILTRHNGKRYIGSSVDIERRWLEHLRDLRGRGHHSTYLQRVYAKHGPNNLEHEVLITCQPDMLLYYEQQFLDQLRPEYNSCPSAHNTLGRPVLDSTREKLSRARRGKPFSETHRERLAESNRNRAKQVIRIDLVTDEELLFQSVTLAAKETGLTIGNVSSACRGRSKTAGGYGWKYQ